MTLNFYKRRSIFLSWLGNIWSDLIFPPEWVIVSNLSKWHSFFIWSFNSIPTDNHGNAQSVRTAVHYTEPLWMYPKCGPSQRAHLLQQLFYMEQSFWEFSFLNFFYNAWLGHDKLMKWIRFYKDIWIHRNFTIYISVLKYGSFTCMYDKKKVDPISLTNN